MPQKRQAKRRARRRPFEPEDNPRERLGVHAGARLRNSPKRSLAKLRVTAIREARREVLSPAPSPVVPGASNWVQLGPTAIPLGQTYSGARVLVSGRVTEILVHPSSPSIMYTATARGGVWKSTDGGVNWAPKSDNEASLAIGALALARSAPDTLYAGTGEGNIYYYRTLYPENSLNEAYEGSGVLKSLDGGNTWTLQGTAQFTGAAFFGIAVHPTDPDTAFAATTRGLFRTTNGGTNWSQLTNGLPAISSSVFAATDVAIDPATPSTVYVAFWGRGVYRTTNGLAANPSFSKITGIPAGSSRIAIAVSPTNPARVYAAVADASDNFSGLYRTVAGGGGAPTWQAIPFSGASVFAYGAYTLNVAVDVSTPDIVYVSGVSLFRIVRNAATGAWSASDIGGPIHPDNHALATHPTDNLRIYAGNDGGVYQSDDGGGTWQDDVNTDLCIAQLEFIDQHPASDAVVIGGTQDNGTEQFRNSGVFNHAADGDGGAAMIDQSNPRNVIHTYYGASPQRSTQGGTFGTWADVSSGLIGGGLFYPPMAADATNSNNVAFGTDRICLDSAQGTGGWPTRVTLPGASGSVSALDYVNSSLIYAATAAGQVYRLTRSGATWTASAIHAAPLPSRWIWDVAAMPGDPNTVVVVLAGFGTSHAWQGAVAASGTSATWTDISGAAPNSLPDVPVNSLQIDPTTATTMYVGTDIGVFRTTNGGASWVSFNNGLPNTAVYDLQLQATTRLLRAATHGRGLWERRLDTTTTPNVELFVRDHVMDTGRMSPSASSIAAPFADPLQGVMLGAPLWWWQCADIKIDSQEGTPPHYQMPVAEVDFVAFESRLAHRSVKRSRVNRAYVQVHNRGVSTATGTLAKILYADASSGLPSLPSDFWTAFPNDSSIAGSPWKPIGAYKTAPPIAPSREVVLEWNWTPPATAAEHSCMLVVVDSSSDPIPTANRVLDVGTLVSRERRVGLRNLHVVNAPPGSAPTLAEIALVARDADDTLLFARAGSGWSIGLVVAKSRIGKLEGNGFKVRKAPASLKAALKKRAQREPDRHFDGKLLRAPALIALEPRARRGLIAGLFRADREIQAFLTVTPSNRAREASVTLVQRAEGTEQAVNGGNTFILRRARR
jgi:photosystem II stability/assembly factor-like uncharacterized protein